MNKDRMICMDWNEIDKLTLTADWIDGHNFVVRRYHGDVLRGSWKFSYTERNEWRCIEAIHHKYRGGLETITGNPIPQDVERYSRWFLLAKIKYIVPPMVVTANGKGK